MNLIYTNMQISKLNLTEEQIAGLTPNFEFELKQTEEKEVEGNPVIMMLLSLVLFYAIYFCAYQVSSSIGLIQILLIIVTAIISSNLFLPEGTLSGIISLENMTPYLLIITIIYFLLGYFTYALLYALTGSTVSKPEDVQAANGPVAILAVVGFYLAYFTMMNPTSSLNAFAALLPISSPFCMPLRVMMGVASSTDVILSIGILIITIIVVAKVSIKIYSNAILNYGKSGIKDIMRMYKQK